MALLTAGALSLGSAAIYATYRYFCPQNDETQYFNKVIEASTALLESAYTSKPELLNGSEKFTVSRLEQLALFLLEVNDPQSKDQAAEFISTLKTYRENLGKFIDNEVPGETTYEKYLDAQQQYKTHPDAKHEFRLHYFEHCLEIKRLSKGDTTEEGAYAKVLQAREQLRLAKLYFPQGSAGLKAKQSQYAHAIRKHLEIVKAWRSQQPGSIIDIHNEALIKKGTENDPFIWKGRSEVLKLPLKGFVPLYNDISTVLSSLEGRICKVDPTRIGKSQGLLRRVRNFITSIWNPDKKNIDNLVSTYQEMKVKQEQLINPPKIDTSAGAPTAAPTPQQQLITFLEQKMSHFNDGVKGFINNHLKVPEETQIQVEGDIITITLPQDVSAGPIDKEQSLDQATFQKLNREACTENIRSHFPDKPIPDSPSEHEPKVSNLQYFRTLGAAGSKALIGGATVSMGKKVKLKIDGNKIEFLEGAPQVKGIPIITPTLKTMTFIPLNDEAAKDEIGTIEVGVKVGWSTVSDQVFIADLGELLSIMS